MLCRKQLGCWNQIELGQEGRNCVVEQGFAMRLVVRRTYVAMPPIHDSTKLATQKAVTHGLNDHGWDFGSRHMQHMNDVINIKQVFLS